MPSRHLTMMAPQPPSWIFFFFFEKLLVTFYFLGFFSRGFFSVNVCARNFIFFSVQKNNMQIK
jgi:hypothetical protein